MKTLKLFKELFKFGLKVVAGTFLFVLILRIIIIFQ